MDTNWLPDPVDNSAPLYRALADQICAAVASGTIPPGAKLPPVRDLAWKIRSSPGAVARAYKLGIDRGALEATVGRGTFARGGQGPAFAIEALTKPHNGVKIDLRGNRAVDVGQDAEISAALSRLIARHGGALPLTDYRRRDDDPAALESLAAWLREGGERASADRLIVTSGAQEGAMACLSATARGGQGVALVEPVIHPGLKDCAAAIGVRLEAVARDDEGMRPDALDAACVRYRPDAVLLTATLQNPTVAVMGPARRAAIVEVARRRDVALIEDDVYGWLIEPRPESFATLAPERCWYVTSFSKCIAAGLRAGLVLTPPGAMLRTLRAHQAMAHHTSWLITGLAAELAESGDAARIRARIAEEIRARVALADRRLGRFGAITHPGGSFACVPMPEAWSSAEFIAAAVARGVLVAPRGAYTVGRGAAGPDFVRVAFGASATRAILDEGLSRLAELLRDGPHPASVLT
jgi:DNA-binding transcriptional MocR family regulator